MNYSSTNTAGVNFNTTSVSNTFAGPNIRSKRGILKSKPNQIVPLDENKDSEDLLQLIINSKTIDEEKQNLFLRHPATNYLIFKKKKIAHW